jgi:eukaryotic-like serine/threonine-protein kinase
VKPRFGKYRLIAKLATGGMAKVFLAEMTGLEGFTKKVVIKRMRSAVARDSAMNAMFFTEAVLAGQLNHPNLVHLYDFSEAGGERFIVMEYVDGPSLKKLMQLAHKRRVLLPVDCCLKVASQVCEGLAYAHEKRDERSGEPMKLVHRDITPDNLLFARNGTVKIADFGIAKAATQLHHTRPGDVKGKFQYIAPEQLLSQPIDARADVFALGVVLCEMLTGVGPFVRENDAAVMDAIVHDEVPPLAALRPDAPAALDAIVRKATAKKPAERFGSALELQEAIDRQLAKLSPVYGPAQLRQVIETLDPAPAPSGDEETTAEGLAFGLDDEQEKGTQVEPVPEGRAITREVAVPGSIDIPITGAQAVPLPAPARRLPVVLMLLGAVVVSAAVTVGVMHALRPPAVIVESVVAPIALGPPDASTAVADAPVLDAGAAVAEVVEEDAGVEDGAPLTPPLSPSGGEGEAEVLDGRARVVLQSTPEATVYLDGKNVGRTPLALPVKYGAHKLRFEDLELGLNKSVPLVVPHEREYSKAFVFEKARLFVMAPDGAVVYVNKRKMGRVPGPVQLYEGSHTVRVVYAATNLDATKRLELKGGDRFEPFVD